MDFGGDWKKLVDYIKALEARVAALEVAAGLTPVPEVAPKPRKRT